MAPRWRLGAGLQTRLGLAWLSLCFLGGLWLEAGWDVGRGTWDVGLDGDDRRGAALVRGVGRSSRAGSRGDQAAPLRSAVLVAGLVLSGGPTGDEPGKDGEMKAEAKAEWTRHGWRDQSRPF
ncbi:hypothetical protein M440DRAFT_1054993 [Trichoderma longibrachiatum ATCC 18648]|uniref:Uncharacterized protein n=1 Tax=Trichoderma longibrachiatum ATCC 18648 TaxID=983965 RepID=A0A2T4BX40_TRILO|nr:hypothetical protein M440DRAFT_1054993 [Trichoderma longibrachiatum ATCC 18648]